MISNFRTVYYGLRTDIRCFVAKYPKIYFAQRHILYGFVDESRMIDLNTEIVIEGFQGSANSFAVVAFKIAQNREVNIAHHIHDPSQLISAVKANIPAILLIRFPDDAILSCLVRFSNFSNELENLELIKYYINKYIDFYRRLIDYKQLLVVADFNTLISSYELIIQQVNERYEKKFNSFYCNKQNVRQVFSKLNQHNQSRFGHINEINIARPSENREKLKVKIYSYFKSSQLNELLEEARDLYQEIIS